MSNLVLKAPFPLSGDQPQAVAKLVRGLADNKKHQVLLGVTGSGKTFTVANVIQRTQKPILVISPNKTLAAQLYQEFRDFFPGNGVGFFVSYYDYYQPEAYVPPTDTYIAKEVDINDELDQLRLRATSLLFSRPDVIIVASVSAIYNLGSPLEYRNKVIKLAADQLLTRRWLIDQLVDLQYGRSRSDLSRGHFRVRGDQIELYPAYQEEIIRLVFEANRLVQITRRPFLDGPEVELAGYLIYPAKHYLADQASLHQAVEQINFDLRQRLSELKQQNKLLEAQRLQERVNYDLAMLKETGYVNGIENYSRYFDGRLPGEPPWTLLDYFNEAYGGDFLTIIDESHLTVPQLNGMYEGDLSRKKILIDFGFRLPSCLDNRPLRFEEILPRLPQIIYLSATPNDWEINQAGGVVEQLLRPTGLVDPQIEIRPTANQIQDLLQEIIQRQAKGERTLIVTLTKKMAEDLASWLADSQNTQAHLVVNYLHADVKTLDRSDLLDDLRSGRSDVLVGVNLLREGLDLPEVSLVVILDADKQGFLRSKTALIQTMGRAARHLQGQIILYADEVSTAMKQAITEVNRRRQIQLAYNKKKGVIPQAVNKPIRERLVEKKTQEKELDLMALTPGEKKKLIPQLRRQMRQAAGELDFEKAIRLRELIKQITG